MLSDVVIDVSDEDGSVLASPRKFRENHRKLKPDFSLIRIQGLDDKKRD